MCTVYAIGAVLVTLPGSRVMREDQRCRSGAPCRGGWRRLPRALPRRSMRYRCRPIHHVPTSPSAATPLPVLTPSVSEWQCPARRTMRITHRPSRGIVSRIARCVWSFAPASGPLGLPMRNRAASPATTMTNSSAKVNVKCHPSRLLGGARGTPSARHVTYRYAAHTATAAHSCAMTANARAPRQSWRGAIAELGVVPQEAEDVHVAAEDGPASVPSSARERHCDSAASVGNIVPADVRLPAPHEMASVPLRSQFRACPRCESWKGPCETWMIENRRATGRPTTRRLSGTVVVWCGAIAQCIWREGGKVRLCRVL